MRTRHDTADCGVMACDSWLRISHVVYQVTCQVIWWRSERRVKEQVRDEWLRAQNKWWKIGVRVQDRNSISCNDFPKVFIITQVTTSLASATSSSNTSAWVWDKEKAITACAVVPGQWKDGMEGEWIWCVSLMALREVELVSRAWFFGCVGGLLLFDTDNLFLRIRLQVIVI